MLPRDIQLRETAVRQDNKLLMTMNLKGFFLQCLSPSSFRGRHDAHPSTVSRLGLSATLEGHRGCVNCLHWNTSGSRVLSGSDDVKLRLWDPYAKKEVAKVDTRHTGNIFSAKVNLG